MSTENDQLKEKVTAYKKVLENTAVFRKAWADNVKPLLVDGLNSFLNDSSLKGTVESSTEIENLESVVLDLGRSSSGITQKLQDAGVRNFMIKHNGSLTYQQLFNGKIMVIVQSPFIEGYSEPKQPAILEIITPAELNRAVITRHLDSLLTILTEWEDFDDESPSRKKAFNPIGFQHTLLPSSGSGEK